jgi:hypothetical protein
MIYSTSRRGAIPQLDASARFDLTQFLDLVAGTGRSFLCDVVRPDTIDSAWATATLRDNPTGTVSTPLPRTCVSPSSGWRQVKHGGHCRRQRHTDIEQHDEIRGRPDVPSVDSVALTSSTIKRRLETGTLSGWTPSGPRTSVTTTAFCLVTHPGT